MERWVKGISKVSGSTRRSGWKTSENRKEEEEEWKEIGYGRGKDREIAGGHDSSGDTSNDWTLKHIVK